MATLAMPNQTSSHSHIEALAAEFQERFNQKSFELTHHLANHPLFKLERLMQLTKSIRETHPKDAYYDAGDIGISTRWDQAPKGVFSIDEAIERIGSAGAWVLLKKAQYDPDYKVLLDETMAELKAFVGKDLTRYIKRDEMIIFITSPKRISSYHIDRECNFLLQIHGEKTIHVFDQRTAKFCRKPKSKLSGQATTTLRFTNRNTRTVRTPTYCGPAPAFTFRLMLLTGFRTETTSPFRLA